MSPASLTKSGFLAVFVVLFLISVPALADPSFVTFEDAINTILDRSTLIANQQANLGSVRALNLPIRLAFAPSLSFDAKQTSIGGVGITSYNNNRQVEGVAQMNFFRGGADYKNWQAASLDETTQQETLQDAYLRAQDGAVVALVNYIQRQKEVAVAQGIVENREESLRIAQQRYRAGYLPEQEMQKISVDLDNAHARLIDAQLLAINATSQLQNVLGHTRVALDWPWHDRFVKAKAPVTASPTGPVARSGSAADDTALAQLLSHRPDWQAAQARVDAEAARLQRNWSLLAPSLDGQFTYGYYYGDLSGPNGQPGPFGGPQWQGTIAVSLPFFDRLTLYANARAQAFVKSEAEIGLEQVRRDARADWETASQSFTAALGSAQRREQTLQTSRHLYEDSLARFRNGRINADDLALEQTRVYDSELLAVRGWAAVHLAYSQLCRAEGRKFPDCRVQ